MADAQELRSAFNKVTQDYFKTQKAIESANATMVTENSQAFIWDMRAVPVGQMSSAQHTQWFTHLDKLMNYSRSISQARNLDIQKQQFSELSKQFFETLKLFKFNNAPIYKLNCNGSFWLSRSTIVSNPYAAKTDRNKKCGNVTDVLNTGK